VTLVALLSLLLAAYAGNTPKMAAAKMSLGAA